MKPVSEKHFWGGGSDLGDFLIPFLLVRIASFFLCAEELVWKMCFRNLSATRSLEIHSSLGNSILPIIYLRFFPLEIIDRVSSGCFLNRIYLSKQFPCCSLCYSLRNCQIQHWYRAHDSNQHSLAIICRLCIGSTELKIFFHFGETFQLSKSHFVLESDHGNCKSYA